MSFDWFTFTAQVVNFVALIALLNHFLYTPITEAMKSREQSIADRLAQAESREQKAEEELRKYSSLNDEIQQQRNLQLEQAKNESESARKKLMTEARNEVEFRRQDWLESLSRDQQTLLKLIRQRASQQIVEISSQTLAQLADADIEQHSFEQFIKQLSSISDADREQFKREAAEGQQSHVHSAFEIPPPWQSKINTALKNEFGLEELAFIVTPSLVLGIEVHLGGSKIGWSVQEHLESLSNELEMILEKQTS